MGRRFGSDEAGLMVLVDSSIWIDYFNGLVTPHTDALDGILGHEMVVMGDLIMVEILQGFSSPSDFNTGKSLLESLPFYSLCGQKMALAAARNYIYLRNKGITPRKTIDMIIATFCIEHRIRLLHNDRDFTYIELNLDLEVYKV